MYVSPRLESRKDQNSVKKVATENIQIYISTPHGMLKAIDEQWSFTVTQHKCLKRSFILDPITKKFCVRTSWKKTKSDRTDRVDIVEGEGDGDGDEGKRTGDA